MKPNLQQTVDIFNLLFCGNKLRPSLHGITGAFNNLDLLLHICQKYMPIAVSFVDGTEIKKCAMNRRCWPAFNPAQESKASG
jgi:hypothetical protein